MALSVTPGVASRRAQALPGSVSKEPGLSSAQADLRRDRPAEPLCNILRPEAASCSCRVTGAVVHGSIGDVSMTRARDVGGALTTSHRAEASTMSFAPRPLPDPVVTVLEPDERVRVESFDRAVIFNYRLMKAFGGQ